MSTKYFCPHCGASIEQGVKFCANCGQQVTATPQQQPPPQQPPPTTQSYAVAQPTQVVHVHTGAPTPTGPSSYSRTVTLLLCIFLGVIGAHQFYVGKSGLGILYIFLVFIAVSPFLAFIDFILILVGSFSDAQGLRVLNW